MTVFSPASSLCVFCGWCDSLHHIGFSSPCCWGLKLGRLMSVLCWSGAWVHPTELLLYCYLNLLGLSVPILFFEETVMWRSSCRVVTLTWRRFWPISVIGKPPAPVNVPLHGWSFICFIASGHHPVSPLQAMVEWFTFVLSSVCIHPQPCCAGHTTFSTVYNHKKAQETCGSWAHAKCPSLSCKYDNRVREGHPIHSMGNNSTRRYLLVLYAMPLFWDWCCLLNLRAQVQVSNLLDDCHSAVVLLSYWIPSLHSLHWLPALNSYLFWSLREQVTQGYKYCFYPLSSSSSFLSSP